MFADNELHVMVDLETLGLTPDSVILSIGATTINQPENCWAETFYQEIALDGPGNSERKVNFKTLQWWLEQGTKLPIGDLNLAATVSQFNYWLLDIGVDKELVLWSNGTDFDIPLLYNVFAQCMIKPGWKYNAVRDYRTVSKMFPQVPKPEFVGQKHNALDDAVNQARHLRMMNDWLTGRLEDATFFNGQ